MAKRRFSAHIGYLFKELPFEMRFAAADAAGFDAVEHPYAEDYEARRVKTLLADCGLAFSQVACAFGQTQLGEKGLAALPGREADFRDNFCRALDYALEIDCPLIHPMAGVPKGAHPDAVKETYLRNIDYAVDKTARLPVTILIEPISQIAVPGYAMSTIGQAVTVQDILGRDNLSILIDTFHAAANGFDLSSWIRENSYRIGHVHIADHPGRREPGTGDIEFEQSLNALSEEGYAGAIGFEYVPATTTAESLRFLPNWKRRLDTLEPAPSRSTAGV